MLKSKQDKALKDTFYQIYLTFSIEMSQKEGGGQDSTKTNLDPIL